MNLDGAVEIEVSSGEKKVIGIGEVFFVEDTSGIEQVMLLLNTPNFHLCFPNQLWLNASSFLPIDYN